MFTQSKRCWGSKICWLAVFLAWVIVFALWLRALMAYGKNYREYQKTYGKPYQSPCEKDKLSCLTLHYLRRLEMLLRDKNLNGSSRKLIFGFVSWNRNFVKKLQNLPWFRFCDNPILNLPCIISLCKLLGRQSRGVHSGQKTESSPIKSQAN